MGDQAQFSDDISALWGPDPQGVLEPAPLGRVEPYPKPPAPANGNGNGSAAAGDDRLDALEAEIRRLSAALAEATAGQPERVDPEALRRDLQAELVAQIEARLAKQAARAAEEELALQGQVTETSAAIADRLARLEQELRHRVERLAAAVEAHELEPVGKHRAHKVREEVRTELAEALAESRAEAESTLDHRLAAAEAASGQRIDELVNQLLPWADRIGALDRRVGELGQTVTATQAEVAESVEAARTSLDGELTHRLHGLQARMAAAVADQASAAERRSALLAEAIDAYRHEGVRPAALGDLRAEVVAATEASVSALEAHLTGRLDELAGHVRAGAAAADRVDIVEQEHARLAAGVDDLRTELAREAEKVAEAAVARLDQRVHELTAAATAPVAGQTAALVQQAAELRQAVDALQAHAQAPAPDPELRAELAGLRAAHDEHEARVARMESEQGQRLEEELRRRLDDAALAGAVLVDERVVAIEQRVVRLGELVDAYRSQSVVSRELEGLRRDLETLLAAQLDTLRAELAAPRDGRDGRDGRDDGDGRRHFWPRHHPTSRA